MQNAILIAISTNNEEYIYARKRADETLRRSFHSTSASASSASAAASFASVSSSSSARARGHRQGHNQAGAVEQDDFKFLSPALCSVSAEFFTQCRMNSMYEHLNHELAQVEHEFDQKVSGDLASKIERKLAR